MNLNVRRTSSSHSRCTFASCITPNDRLQNIPRSTRFKAIKTKKIYIPNGARACHYHISGDHFSADDLFLKKFTQIQIEALIDLLCDSSFNNFSAPGR